MKRLRPTKQYDKTNSRSDRYQYSICEIPFGDDELNFFDYNQSYQGLLTQSQLSEDVLELQEELIKMVWETVEVSCNERQKAILKMYFVQGMTQSEIAKEFDIHQSGIVKYFWGNAYYSNKDKNKRIYGGIFKKIRMILLRNPKALQIIEQLKEKQEI